MVAPANAVDKVRSNGTLEIPPARKPSEFTLGLIDAATFAKQAKPPTWLIKRLLVKGQPCVVGGAKKVLKTTSVIDLAISIASCTPFLGHFDTYKAHRVVIISGESGEWTIYETAKRICQARQLDFDRLASNLYLGFRLPQLANDRHLARVEHDLKAVGAEVAIIDPLYLALLSGMDAQHVSAANMYQMGPLLLGVAETCLSVGCTPIFVHHTRMHPGKTGEPAELEDLAYAGIQEFARQWLLFSRRKPYDPDAGTHHLWMSAGGSVGHGGLWAVDVDEGRLQDDFSGRRWDVTVATAGQAAAVEDESGEERKARKDAEQIRKDGSTILATLDRVDKDRKGHGYTKVRDLAKLNSGRMTRAVQDLIEQGVILDGKGKASIGSGAERDVRMLRRVPLEVRQ